MSTVLLGEAFRERISEFDAPIEVLDEAGQTVGHFLPTALFGNFMDAWLEREFTADEVNRLRQQTGGRPLAEIWHDLGRK